MRRIAFVSLCSIVLASLGLLIGPAKAGDYNYGDGYYGHRYDDGGYYGHRSNDDGYYRRRHRGHTWYTSNCCYRRVVRHTAWYERTHRYGYYGNGYYRHRYYGDYGRPYYRYGNYRPYDHHYHGDYVYRPYRYYGYGSVGYASYAGCERIPLADGRGGWVWSRRAGCF